MSSTLHTGGQMKTDLFSKIHGP